MDNLADEIDKCPLNQGCLVMFTLGPRKLPIMQSSRVIHRSGVAQVLKWMEGQSGLSKLSVIFVGVRC